MAASRCRETARTVGKTVDDSQELQFSSLLRQLAEGVVSVVDVLVPLLTLARHQNLHGHVIHLSGPRGLGGT